MVLKVLPWCNSALVEKVTTNSRLRPLRCRVHFNQIKVVKRRNYDEFKEDFIETIDSDNGEKDDQVEMDKDKPKEVNIGDEEVKDDDSQMPDELSVHMDSKYNLRPRRKISYK